MPLKNIDSYVLFWIQYTDYALFGKSGLEVKALELELEGSRFKPR